VGEAFKSKAAVLFSNLVEVTTRVHSSIAAIAPPDEDREYDETASFL
jgi:hypothetical protein